MSLCYANEINTTQFVDKTKNSILLKDPFGNHYESVTQPGPYTGLYSTTQGDINKLPQFKGQKQGTAPWCWAAAASMMLYSHAIKKTPCQIVSESLKRDCCSWKTKILGDWKCWVGGDVSRTLTHYGIPSYTIPVLSQSPTQKAELVLNELQKGKPTTLILRRTTIPNSKGFWFHAVVAYGASHFEPNSKAPLELIVYDPLVGAVTVTPQELQAYRNNFDKNGAIYTWYSTIHL